MPQPVATAGALSTTLQARLLRARIPALACALLVAACLAIARPVVEMPLDDDGPYIRSAQILAQTGHLVYTGWATPMIGWQLYISALFIRVLGFSFTAARLSTLLASMAAAFLFQRILVRAGLRERLAFFGTLGLVLSPLYLMLSVPMMTDIGGMAAIIICLYGCLRALQAPTGMSCTRWLFAAVAGNALLGTSRQIAWLGVLVMVPCTLWLLRPRYGLYSRTLLAGIAFTLGGIAFIFACLHWLNRQPYYVPIQPMGFHPSLRRLPFQLTGVYCELPLLLLSIVVLFIPQLWSAPRRSARPRALALVLLLCLGYPLLAAWPGSRQLLPLQPTGSLPGSWVNIYGTHFGMAMAGAMPRFLSISVQVVFTMLCLAACLGIVRVLRLPATPERSPHITQPSVPSWRQLAMLLGPFSIAYTLLLVPSAVFLLYDRYMLSLLPIVALCLLRLYHDRVSNSIPAAGTLAIGLWAAYAVVCTHNFCSLYRGRLTLARELEAAGIPLTAVDSGWEYNLWTELQHAPSINDEHIVLPAGFYQKPPKQAVCYDFWLDKTPHIHPRYLVSFDPKLCGGPAGFAPVTYSRWLGHPGTLYVVLDTPPSPTPSP